MLRPKLPPKSDNKNEIHSQMLNENNSQLNSHPVVHASKEIINTYVGTTGKSYEIVESDMHEQEASLKIRLLKRQNVLNRKRRTADTSDNNDSSISSSSHYNISPRIKRNVN